MAEKGVATKRVSIALARRAFEVSETCFRYSPKRENRRPDYGVTEETGDMLRVTPRAAVIDPRRRPHLRAETLEEARVLLPGAYIYALEAEWRAWRGGNGRPRLRSPDAAFLSRVRTRPGVARQGGW